MKILLAGGGTGGSAIPLLAVAEEIKKIQPDTQFLFVGTKGGPEKVFVANAGIRFTTIPAGKLRRYFSWQNFISPFESLVGFIKAISIILKFRPDLVFSAGGYVAVPLIYAAKLFGTKVLIHQQDVRVTLSNSLVAPLANKITVTFQTSLKDFPSGTGLKGATSEKVIWTGNPVRTDLQKFRDLSPAEKAGLRTSLGLKNDMPVLLVLGGATGAAGLNRVLEEALPHLVKTWQVVHSTGKGKGLNFNHENYHPYEIISDLGPYYAAADLVVTRAGLSTLSELSYLGKTIIIVPMPASHQLDNAKIFDDAKAALVFSQEELTAELLMSAIKKLLYNANWQQELSENISKLMPRDAAVKIAKIIVELCQKKN